MTNAPRPRSTAKTGNELNSDLEIMDKFRAIPRGLENGRPAEMFAWGVSLVLTSKIVMALTAPALAAGSMTIDPYRGSIDFDRWFFLLGGVLDSVGLIGYAIALYALVRVIADAIRSAGSLADEPSQERTED